MRFRNTGPYFLPRTVESDHVVPAVGDRQAVRCVITAVAELDRDCILLPLLAGDAVDRLGIQLIGVEVTVGGVSGHRPERIDRNVFDRESVRRLAIIPVREHVQVDGILVGVQAPT